MTILTLAPEEREIVRRAMEATFRYFSLDFHTRLGVTPEEMRGLLKDWPHVSDFADDSIACLAINSTMNDLLNGVGISDQEARELVGVDRSEMLRVYQKWSKNRGWSAMGIR